MEEIIEEKKSPFVGNGKGRVYRAGVAARLAGLSVETLRVWERRYSLTDTDRSARGQRLYSDTQVRRLGLLKQLVDHGHQISALVNLVDEQLQTMLGVSGSGGNRAGGPIRVALIGERLAQRIDAGGRDSLPLDVCCKRATLDDASTLSSEVNAEVLLIELSELHASALPLIVRAQKSSGALAVVVLYRFCASAVIRQLRDQGCLVARIPPDLGEIVMLCQAALAGQRVEQPKQQSEESTPRRFDDVALTVIASHKNDVNCECPRHLADILMMVGSFERYSAQCASRNADDAQLHEELGLAASQARVVLELALDRLARAEGLLLPISVEATRESRGV